MKKIIALLMIFSSIACIKKENEANEKSVGKTRVAYVIAGSLGDKSYYDNGQRGIDRLKNEFGAETLTIEIGNDPSRYQSSLELARQWNPNIVYLISHGFEDLAKEYADKYTDIEWVNLSIPMESPDKNLYSIAFNVAQGSYLAGIVAALVTSNEEMDQANTNRSVGMIVGMKNPQMDQDYTIPYAAGVKFVDPSIKVETLYTETFTDPVRGKQAATQLYNEGVDVIYQAAGLTGLGVLEAAAENSGYAIGVDVNQNGTHPGNILTSVTFDFGNSITSFYRTYQENSLEKGEAFVFGMAEGAVTLVLDSNSTNIIPANLLEKIQKYSTEIIEGKIAKEFQ